MNALGTWLANPALFAAGAALIAVPILIHLLNRRKFKVVDWAAMDFLLEADKKNRRRVRLENWLLLFLRCLAVFLIGLLLARPFDSSGLAARLLDAQKFERIVIVDDSLSMQSRIGNRSAMEIARERLVDLARAFAEEKPENTLTLWVTSKPEQRKFNGAPIGSPAGVDDIAQELSRLEASQLPARWEASLQELDDYLSTQPPNVNRIVYLLTDLRRRDWQGESAEEKEAKPAGAVLESTPVVEKLRSVAKRAQGCYLIDVGDSEDRNLVLQGISSEKSLVAGVDSRFEVLVANTGSQSINDIRLKLTAGDSVPLYQSIEQLAPGEQLSRTFSLTFAGDDTDRTPEDINLSRRVKVEVSPERSGDDDRLAADSVAFFAARVVAGIPTLLVDGDPSAAYGKAETFYLKRALSPPGKVISGVAPEVITDAELETAELKKYQVIFLCNVYRVSEKVVDQLNKWVEQGGGLVILPGSQVDEADFNNVFFGTSENEGKGLSPVRLDSIAGDENEKEWKNFRIIDEQHPVLKDFVGQQNPILTKAQVYRWWKLNPPAKRESSPSNVLLRLTDADDSIAVVERSFGRGHVIISTFPADADWTNWTSDPSYILIMQQLVRYLASGGAAQGTLRVGEPLRSELDLTHYSLDAELELPNQKKTHLQATQAAGGEANHWLLESPPTAQQGFYTLKLTGRDGSGATLGFAANVEPSEGDLRRVNLPAFEKELSDANIKILSGVNSGVGGLGNHMEIWKYVLWLLVALLLGEQLLGWAFGLRR